jgi:hypothetical protein
MELRVMVGQDGSLKRGARRLLFAAVIFAGAPAGHALGQPRPPATALDARGEVFAALFAASATHAAELRSADQRLKAQRRTLVALQAEVNAGRAKLAALTEAQERYVAALAERDNTYARAVEDLRRNITQIATTPERIALLAQRREGRRAEVRNALDAQIRDQRAKGVYTSDAAYLADLRALAAITLDDKGNGEATTEDSLARYEEITRLDPTASADWRQLADLYREAGSSASALRAAKRSADTAKSPGDRAAALELVAEMAADARDLRGALDAARQSLEVRQSLAGNADQTSLLRLSGALARIGDILIEQSELATAEASNAEALSLARRVAALAPENLELQRPVALVLHAQAYVRNARGDPEGAAALQRESVDIRRRLLATDPKSEALLRGMKDGLWMLFNYVGLAKDAVGRRQVAEEQEAISARLAASAPDAEGALRDMFEVTRQTAAAKFLEKDYAGSRASHLKSLEFAYRLFKTNRNDPLLQTQIDLTIGSVAASYRLSASGTGARRDSSDRLHVLRDGLAELRPLAAAHPEQPQWLWVQSEMLISIAGYEQGERDNKAALVHMEEALQLLRRFAQQRPTDTRAARLIDGTAASVQKLRSLAGA